MPAPSIAPHALRVDSATGEAVLLGGLSPTSGLRHFPPAPVCPFTGSDDVELIELPRAGTVWLHTTVNSAPPGYAGTVPYALGVVQLDGDPGLRVVSRLTGPGLAVGTRVHLDAEELPGPDGQPVLTWVFRS
jgi:uncharacterized OB-fold protein